MKQLKFQLGKTLYHSFISYQCFLTKAKEYQSNLSYYLIGNPKNEPLLLLHGFGDNKETFLSTANFLKSKYFIIIPDLPGFGKSPKDKQRVHDLDYMTEALVALLNQLGVKKFHLGGSSMGGAISMNLALQAPENIKSLTLISSAGFYQENVRSVFNDFIEGNNIFQVKSEEEFSQLLQRVFYKKPYIPKTLLTFLAAHSIQNHDWYGKLILDLTSNITTYEEMIKQQSLFFNHKVQKIAAPAHLIWGDKDSIFPIELAHLAKNLFPNCSLSIVENAGHAPHIEQFKSYQSSFSNFLKDLNHL